MKSIVFSLCLFLLFSCNSKPESSTIDGTIFELLPESQTAIDHKFGTLPHANIEGGGVAVGDLNGDGLQDIFFVGDSLHSLYQNLGNLEFENVFNKSNITPYRGGTSVAIYDINNDGLNDIILGRRSTSNNPLYSLINNGNASLEIMASNLMIYLNKGNFKFAQDSSYYIKTQANVSGITIADFDKNTLIDIVISSWDVDFQSNNSALLNFENLHPEKNQSSIQIFKQYHPTIFSEESKQLNVANSSIFPTSYSLIASDLDNDGWTDLLVTNDFDLPDLYYKNIEGAKFELQKQQSISSFYSMGIDAADINNDCLIDVATTDMRPINYQRCKTAKFEKPYDWEVLKNDKGLLLANQQVKNTIKINQQDFQFSEISEMIGVDASEWSWAVLLADLNNNGFKDITIANGYYYQYLLEHDTPLLLDSIMKDKGINALVELIKSDTLSASYFQNSFFKNTGDLNFVNMTEIWLKSISLNSRGAAYADLDNDGDLDIVLNNSKQKSVVLQNLTSDKTQANYLRVELKSTEFSVLHSTATIYYNDNKQFVELNPCRGFYSSSEHFIHFGLDSINEIDSLYLKWANGQDTLLKDIKANQVLSINYKTSSKRELQAISLNTPLFFQTHPFNPAYVHKENDYIDFQQNIMLPQMYSRSGPYMEFGDLTQNGLDDLIIGGSLGQPPTIYHQIDTGAFVKFNYPFLEEETTYEDAGIEIIDIDGDGKKDIFIASGGNEEAEGHTMYTPRYYLNKGGKFEKYTIPFISQSSSIVKSTIWNDEVLLFLGGRIRPWNYPLNPKSYLLVYRNNQWIDITTEIAEEFEMLGMVTDAIWTDFDSDKKIDLVLVGEYMPPTFFRNNGVSFSNVTKEQLKSQKLNGLYTSIASSDFNQDGYPDYVLGNLGLNTRYAASKQFPLEIFANDFDENGSLDVITAYYEDERLYPVKQLATFKSKINGFSKKYYKVSKFANETISDIFNVEKIKAGFHGEAHTTASLILLSEEGLGYSMQTLPIWAQVAPISDMEIYDINKDGFEDIFIVGNYYPVEVERGKYTAQKGLILLGNGDGSFQEILPRQSGFWAEGDTRSIRIVNKTSENPLVIVGVNNDSLLTFKIIKDY